MLLYTTIHTSGWILLIVGNNPWLNVFSELCKTSKKCNQIIGHKKKQYNNSQGKELWWLCLMKPRIYLPEDTETRNSISMKFLLSLKHMLGRKMSGYFSITFLSVSTWKDEKCFLFFPLSKNCSNRCFSKWVVFIIFFISWQASDRNFKRN